MNKLWRIKLWEKDTTLELDNFLIVAKDFILAMDKAIELAKKKFKEEDYEIDFVFKEISFEGEIEG